MKYAMLIYETEADFDGRTNEHKEAFWGAWHAYHQQLVKAGVIVGGNALRPPSTGTTVRARGDRRHVQDGPYAAPTCP